MVSELEVSVGLYHKRPPCSFHITGVVWLDWQREDHLAWYQSRGLEFNFPWLHIFFSAARNNSHLPCCSLSMLMSRARGRDSYAGGGMLDHSIIGSHPFPYHRSFIVGLAEGGSVAVSSLNLCGSDLLK
jgi:hypothetical protein